MNRVSQTAAEFMDRLEHPLKREIEALRQIVRDADGRLEEVVKWNAPSYAVNGEDRITFNLRGKGTIRLIFHAGAKKKNMNVRSALGEDPTGLLKWAADDRATVELTGMEDVREKEERLVSVVQRWLEATS